MKLKSFRGRLTPQSGLSASQLAQERIKLSTNKGLIGYRVNKLQIITAKPGKGTTTEFVVKIFTQKQTSVDGDIDFTNPVLLGVAYETDSTSGDNPTSQTIIFDTAKFNQDIYVTAQDNSGGSNDVNYYIELEQVKLDVTEATVATLKDMRGRE